MLKGPRARVDLWKFDGPVKRGRHGSLVSRKGFSIPVLPFSAKNIHGTRADAIFDLTIKKDGGRHRAYKPGLLFPVDYTPRLRLSPFGFNPNDKKREKDQRHALFSRRASCRDRACFQQNRRATEVVVSHEITDDRDKARGR